MQLHVKKPDSTLGRDSLIFVSLLFLHSIAYVSMYPQLGERLGSLSAIPVVVFAWLQGKKAGVIGSIAAISMNIGLSYLLTNDITTTYDLGNLIGMFVMLVIAVVVGHASELNSKLQSEISKRKELEKLLEEKSKMCDVLITEKAKTENRKKADLEAEIYDLKRELLAPKLS